MTKRSSRLPRHTYRPIAVDSMHRVLDAVAGGNNIYQAVNAQLADHPVEYRTSAVLRTCALFSLLGSAPVSRADAAAAATCECTAPWDRPGKPSFNEGQFREQKLLLIPIAGMA